MPTYIFNCTKCNNSFEEFCYISDLKGLKPQCSKCQSLEVERDFKSESAGVIESQKTIGMLADKNTGKMSSDERESLTKKHYDYLKKMKGV